MQFETRKEEFLKVLQIVQNAISQKNTLPILSNMLIETQENNLKLTATDLDIGITSYVETKAKEQGAITVPAKKLLDIIKELPSNDNVSVVLKKNNMITIDCGKSHFKIIGLSKDEFPQIPAFKNKESIIVPQKLLKEMLSMTTFAVSKDETRYVLNGVLAVIDKDSLQFVATDGRRLALAKKTLPKKTTITKKIIIPSKTVQELIRMLGDEGNVTILFSDSQIFVDLGKTQVISRLIEGEFPNYEQVIPNETSEKIKINREEFLAATKRANLFTNPDSLAVRLDVSKQKMVVSKNAPYIGEVKEEIGVQYKGKNLSIGFNPVYLIDVLKSLDDETIEFELDDSEKPGVIRKNSEYTYVVLPMQLT